MLISLHLALPLLLFFRYPDLSASLMIPYPLGLPMGPLLELQNGAPCLCVSLQSPRGCIAAALCCVRRHAQAAPYICAPAITDTPIGVLRAITAVAPHVA